MHEQLEMAGPIDWLVGWQSQINVFYQTINNNNNNNNEASEMMSSDYFYAAAVGISSQMIQLVQKFWLFKRGCAQQVEQQASKQAIRTNLSEKCTCI